MADWTTEDVAQRFVEAVETGRRLPRVRVQGFFSVWPAFAREGYPEEEYHYRPVPPSPHAIERMMETMRWMLWLEEEQRHLVWMRAKQIEWKDVCRRIGCDRTTGWRRWQKALQLVVQHLNAEHLLPTRQ